MSLFPTSKHAPHAHPSTSQPDQAPDLGVASPPINNTTTTKRTTRSQLTLPESLLTGMSLDRSPLKEARKINSHPHSSNPIAHSNLDGTRSRGPTQSPQTPCSPLPDTSMGIDETDDELLLSPKKHPDLDSPRPVPMPIISATEPSPSPSPMRRAQKRGSSPVDEPRVPSPDENIREQKRAKRDRTPGPFDFPESPSPANVPGAFDFPESPAPAPAPIARPHSKSKDKARAKDKADLFSPSAVSSTPSRGRGMSMPPVPFFGRAMDVDEDMDTPTANGADADVPLDTVASPFASGSAPMTPRSRKDARARSVPPKSAFDESAPVGPGNGLFMPGALPHINFMKVPPSPSKSRRSPSKSPKKMARVFSAPPEMAYEPQPVFTVPQRAFTVPLADDPAVEPLAHGGRERVEREPAASAHSGPSTTSGADVAPAPIVVFPLPPRGHRRNPSVPATPAAIVALRPGAPLSPLTPLPETPHPILIKKRMEAAAKGKGKAREEPVPVPPVPVADARSEVGATERKEAREKKKSEGGDARKSDAGGARSEASTAARSSSKAGAPSGASKLPRLPVGAQMRQSTLAFLQKPKVGGLKKAMKTREQSSASPRPKEKEKNKRGEGSSTGKSNPPADKSSGSGMTEKREFLVPIPGKSTATGKKTLTAATGTGKKTMSSLAAASRAPAKGAAKVVAAGKRAAASSRVTRSSALKEKERKMSIGDVVENGMEEPQGAQAADVGASSSIMDQDTPTMTGPIPTDIPEPALSPMHVNERPKTPDNALNSKSQPKTPTPKTPSKDDSRKSLGSVFSFAAPTSSSLAKVSTPSPGKKSRHSSPMKPSASMSSVKPASAAAAIPIRRAGTVSQIPRPSLAVLLAEDGSARPVSSLSNLSMALEKLTMPPPAKPPSGVGRPSTSMGFNRELTDDDDEGKGKGKGKARDDGGLGRATATKTAPPLKKSSTLSSLSTPASGASQQSAPRQKVAPPGAFFSKGRVGVSAGPRRVFGIGGPQGQKASKRTALPTVEGSPVKGGTTFMEEPEGMDVDDAQTSGVIPMAPLTFSEGASQSELGAAALTGSAVADDDDEEPVEGWKRHGRRASLASHMLSQSLSVLPQTPTDSADMGPPAVPGRRIVSDSSTSNGTPGEKVRAGAAHVSSKKAGTSANGDTPRAPASLDVLKDCTIFVDVRTDDGDDAGSLFVEMLKGLGAKLSGRVGPRCTHIVYKNGLMSTLTRYRLLNDPKPHVVGIAWVVECVEHRAQVDEAKFKVDLEGVNVAGTNKRRRSMLPKQLSMMSPVRNPASNDPETEADVSMAASSSSMLIDNEDSAARAELDSLPPLERARRRRMMNGS